MSADEIRKLADKVTVGVKGGRHGRVHETDIVLPEISMFDRMEISSAILAYAAMVERCEKARSKIAKHNKVFREVWGHDDVFDGNKMLDYILKGATNA